MTADIELLPLPEPLRRLPAWSAIESYARANVLHHTAAQAAEIEALRAEARDLRKRQAGWERHVASAGCEYVREGERDVLVNRRAERLAEALREVDKQLDDVEPYADARAVERCHETIRAALDQERKDD